MTMTARHAIFVAVVLTVGLAACFSATSSEPIAVSPILVGWVQQRGEIRIYPKKSDLGKLFDGSCISGVMQDGSTVPSRLLGRRFKVYVELVDGDAIKELVASDASVGLKNYCNSQKIALITRLEPFDAKAPTAAR